MNRHDATSTTLKETDRNLGVQRGICAVAFLAVSSCGNTSPSAVSPEASVGPARSAAPSQSNDKPAPVASASTPAASATAASSAASAATTASNEASAAAPQDDPPGEALARHFAELLRQRVAQGALLPAPRGGDDNNPFALVRSSDELAAEAPRFVLSHDGKRIAFARTSSGRQSSLWLAESDGSGARRVFDLDSDVAAFAGGSTEAVDSEALFDLAFAHDDSGVYFQADGWATSFALYRFDLKTNQTKFVVDANGYTVVNACPKRPALAGHLVAYRHSYSVLRLQAIDLYFLLDSAGTEVGILGPEPANVDRYLHNTCSQQRSFAAPSLPPLPQHLQGTPACGEGRVLRYAPVRFLDGSVLPVFYIVATEHAKTPFDQLSLDMFESPPLDLATLSDVEMFEANCASAE